jgi:ABC-type glycerol-3-phosphate transport system permease component
MASRARSIRWLPALVVLGLLSISTIYPLVFVGLTALKTTSNYAADPLGLPDPFTTEFLERAIEAGNLGQYMLNSLFVVGSAVAILTVAASLAGFALAHLRFPARGILLIGIVGLMTVPAAVLMIPLYRTVGQLGLINTYPGLILTYAALYLPFSIYLVASYGAGLPREILEAARVDGAGLWATFRRIAVPLSRPAIATLVTLNFLWLWNELLFGLLILQDPAKRTLQVGLATLQGQHTTPIPLLAAGLLVSLAPVLIVFLLSQRTLARGLTAGAVK